MESIARLTMQQTNASVLLGHSSELEFSGIRNVPDASRSENDVFQSKVNYG